MKNALLSSLLKPLENDWAWQNARPFAPIIVANPWDKKNSSAPVASQKVAPARIFSPSLPPKFFQEMAPYARWAQEMTGIPASVILAQAALESGWGRYAPGNNFFGIKGEGPSGSLLLWTREFRQGRMVRTLGRFRSYSSPLESFLDYARLLSSAPHFRHAMAQANSPERFIQALQSGPTKYATDPHYVEKILSMITRYQLKNYDPIR